MRDTLSINDGEYSEYGATPRDEKSRLKAARRALAAGFASLPKPENNFELAEDEDEETEEEVAALTEEDAAERDARIKAAREREEQLELERRSSVVKKGLPRPIAVNAQAILDDLNSTISQTDELSEAIRLINLEMALLMRHDTLAHPLPGTSIPGGTASEYDMPEDEFVAAAKSAIHAELSSALGLPGATDDQVRLAIGATASEDPKAFEHTWAEEKSGLVLEPSSRQWVEADSLSPQQLSAAYRAMIDSSRDKMIQQATVAAKAEKKLGKQLGGYVALNMKARQSITQLMDEIQSTKRDLETFNMLRSMEEAAAPSRLEKKRDEVASLEKRERDLQSRYAELLDERKERQAAIEQVSTILWCLGRR
jgi:pre-mRNA-splicing factor CDC5/CEF1